MFSITDVRRMLNRISPGADKAQLGDLLMGDTVSGTLELSGFSDGESRTYEIDHSGDAEFVGPLSIPVFNAAAGFSVEIDLAGTTGSKFRVIATHDANEYVYAADSPDESGSGSATLTWSRTGHKLQQYD